MDISERSDVPEPASENDSPSVGQRRSRRLSDKVLVTFHAACDLREFQVARQLLAVLEDMVTHGSFRSSSDRRRSTEALVAAHERLWNLKHRSSVT